VQVRSTQGYDWRLPVPRAGQGQGLRIYPCASLNRAANCSMIQKPIPPYRPRALRPLSGGSGASKRPGKGVLAVSQPAAPAHSLARRPKRTRLWICSAVECRCLFPSRSCGVQSHVRLLRKSTTSKGAKRAREELRLHVQLAGSGYVSFAPAPTTAPFSLAPAMTMTESPPAGR
jgi:hypothetical protein